MRTLLLAAVVLGLTVAARADDKKPDDKKPEPSLKVGDAAPAIKADKWLQGSPVTEFAAGKVDTAFLERTLANNGEQ